MFRPFLILGGCVLLVLGQGSFGEPEPPIKLGERSKTNANGRGTSLDESVLDILMDLEERSSVAAPEEKIDERASGAAPEEKIDERGSGAAPEEKIDERSNDVDNSGISTPDEPPEENNADGSLFEGDLVLTKAQQAAIDAATVGNGNPQKRKFLKSVRKWPNKIVKFSPLSGVTAWKQAIQAGMRHIEANTCIRFQQSNSGPRLNFISGTGCYSYLGMQSNAQTVSIKYPGCTRLGTVVHEILHAMGMLHEQSRPDRDNYVTISHGNILSGRERNFKKYAFAEVDTGKIAYDIGSVMHYGARAFSKNGQNTITPKDPSKSHLLGQRSGLAQADIAIVAAMYGCSDTGGGGSSTSKPTTQSPVTTRRPTTSNPTGNCKDTWKFCRTYKSRGECSSSHSRYNSMIKYCKKTCNLCNATPRPTTAYCLDKWRYCRNYKTYGWCSASHSRYNQMTKYCKKTCNFCNGLPTTPTPTSGTSCADTSTTCKQYQLRRYCRDSTANRYFAMMKRSCRKTCGFCSGMCLDMDLTRYCQSWKRRGYCSSSSRFSKYMTKNCEKTCGKC